ncbi:MAG: translation elongation factor Ts, partial [Clostridia bacterium]|nr:translation elongation factor Ts [Clostridia bacterium]
KEDVDAAALESERQIYLTQAMNEGRPEQVAQKIVEGRINKYFKEVCLLEQEYFRDPTKTIRDLITEAVAKTGEKITLRRFTRYEMGEGLEKRSDNFAEEVAKQASGN